MNIAGHKFACITAWGALLLGAASQCGCAMHQIYSDLDGYDHPDKKDGYERLIHVDQHGNVHRGLEPNNAESDDADHAPTPVPLQSEFPAPTPAGVSLSEQSGEFYKNLEALRREQNSAAAQAAAVTQIAAHAVAKPDLPEKLEIPTGVEPTVVRSKRFTLEYDDTLLGPDGIAKVELYGTRDNGRTWELLGEDQDRRSPYVVEMDEEGLFGFRIAVAGKNGLASRPPRGGELPELWVQVDCDVPAFLGNLRAGEGEVVIADDEATADGASRRDMHAHDAVQHGQVRKASHSERSDSAVHDADADWQTHLASAITDLEIELAGRNMASGEEGDVAPAKRAALTDEQRARLDGRLRLLYAAAGRHEDAIRSSEHQSTEENEFWSQQMDSLHLLLDSDDQLSPARRSAAALDRLRDAEDKLAALSELHVRNLTFCTAAHSFGVFETSVAGDRWKHSDYREAKFEPQQPVVLYFEVDNFTSEQQTSREFPEGAWRTSLRGRYTILDRAGQPLERRELKLRDDVCRNRRHDYFVAYKTWMPQLNPGRYTLELLVEDAIAGKIGTSTIDFEIVAR